MPVFITLTISRFNTKPMSVEIQVLFGRCHEVLYGNGFPAGVLGTLSSVTKSELCNLALGPNLTFSQGCCLPGSFVLKE